MANFPPPGPSDPGAAMRDLGQKSCPERLLRDLKRAIATARTEEDRQIFADAYQRLRARRRADIDRG